MALARVDSGASEADSEAAATGSEMATGRESGVATG